MANLINKPMVVNRHGEVYSPDGLVGMADSKQFLNSLGSQQAITTLTALLPTVIQQNYYEVKLSDFVDIEVGGGNPFAAEYFNWSTGITGGDFEAGLINQGSNQSESQSDDIWVEPIKRAAVTWKKNVGYNIIEQGTFAQGTQNMDLIVQKYQARAKEYQLGLQKTVFYGLKSNSAIGGLLTQSGVTANTTVIPKFLSSMTAAEFNAVLSSIYAAYQTNCNLTTEPDTFAIPASDYNGLVSFVSESFPIAGSTRLEVLENAFKKYTGNDNFKVIKTAYADKTRNSAVSGLNKNVYVLYKKAPDSLIMNVPIDFTVTLPTSPNGGFDYISAAYSRFTGVTPLRPQEMLYFTHAV